MVPITTVAELRSYLQTHPHTLTTPLATIDELTGGTANFVWRITETSGRTAIVKHAESYIRSNPSMRFAAALMPFEAAALTFAKRALGSTTDGGIVRIPELYAADEENHVLVLEDCGSRNLKAAYTDASLDVVAFGAEVARWAARLHREVPKSLIRDNETARSLYRFSYNGLAASLQKHGLDPALGERVNREYGALLLTDDEQVCHGDLWSGNVLVGDDGRGLAIVDWEMCRRGCAATDVGQFAAEAFLLDHFRGGRGLLDAFLRAYKEENKPGRTFVKRAAVHFGTHLAFWPTWVKWADEEGTREVIKFGVEVIERALMEDWTWLEGSTLRKIMPRA